MKHLVRSLLVDGAPPLTLGECARLVREAHDYLARRGADAIERAWHAKGDPNWGSLVKRIQVDLPTDGRPELIGLTKSEHNLVEVLNQCATMERLLDALDWAQTAASGLDDYTVERCHPTTSSAQIAGKKVLLDNDLVLIGPDGTTARFEVSDVVSEADGNRKERRDRESLGVPDLPADQSGSATVWPAGRVFLVVSETFAKVLRPKCVPKKGRPYRYVEVKADGPTRVFEVVPAVVR